MTNSKYGKIIAITTTVCVIALGLAFMFCCAHLFFTGGGGKPYTREKVGDYLMVLAAPSFITVAVTVAGFIYAYVNRIKDDENISRTNSELLESFASRYVFESFDDETKVSVLALRKKRMIINVISWGISAVCMILMLLYLILLTDFTQSTINKDIVSAMTVVLPLTALAAAIHIPKFYITEKISIKELDLLKASIKEHGAPAKKEKTEAKFDYTSVVKYIILGVAIIFVVIGIFNGGVEDVLGKAAKLCQECVGIG